MKSVNYLAVLSLFIFGCEDVSKNPDGKIPVGKDYERPLFEGYKIFRSGSRQISLADASGRLVVGPTVSEYSHQYPFIFGRVGESDWREISDTTGYFILDAQSGRIDKGLDKSEWNSLLKSFGVQTNPPLRNP